MNRFENWICSTALWQRMTQRRVLPWLLEGAELGEHLLEIGAGAGAATRELRRHAARVTSLEYSAKLIATLARRALPSEGAPPLNGTVVQGDATNLPFPNETFSAVIAVLMLHHLKSPEAQRATFAETFRVLRPGGIFLALDIPDAWLHRIAHIRSTFVPLSLSTAPAWLTAAGFSSVSTSSQSGAFRLHAIRSRCGEVS